MVPKLVAEDIPLLFSLLSDVFPGIEYTRAEMTGLKDQIRKVRRGDWQTSFLNRIEVSIIILQL